MTAPLNLRDMLEIKMQYDGERQKVLAQNIANKDVPGYKTHDLQRLDFKNMVAAHSSALAMTTPSPMHFSGINSGGGSFPTVKPHNSFDMDITGNNISI